MGRFQFLVLLQLPQIIQVFIEHGACSNMKTQKKPIEVSAQRVHKRNHYLTNYAHCVVKIDLVFGADMIAVKIMIHLWCVVFHGGWDVGLVLLG